MPKSATSFYPPRARWYSGLWNAAYLLRRQLHLDALRLPRELGAGSFLLVVMVPGYAWLAFRQKTLATFVICGYAAALMVFVVWLGHLPAGLALGTMVALHTLSLLRGLRHWPREVSLGGQAVRGLAASLGLALLVYLPLQHLVERHLFVPLRIGDDVLVVGVSHDPRAIQRGDLIAYRIAPQRRGNVWLLGGFGMGRVEGLAGDTIQFGREGYHIGGITRPRRAQMPSEEEWVVPENHWFVWPDSGMTLSGHAANVTPLLQELALVPTTRLVGRPFSTWFGREQVQP